MSMWVDQEIDRVMSRTVVYQDFWVLKITVVLEAEVGGCGGLDNSWFYPWRDWSLSDCGRSGIKT